MSIVCNLTADVAVTAELPLRSEPVQLPRYGGTLTDTTISDPKTFNLWTAMETSSTNTVQMLFEPLIARDPQTLRWQGRLAQLPTISQDGLRWTLRLRPGLKWSDEHPLTADDIIFTLDMIYDEKTGSLWRNAMLVDIPGPAPQKPQRRPITYRKVDARTVEFRFPQPYAPAREMLSFPIAPRHRLEAAWKSGRFNVAWGVNTPVTDLVSSGPWVMQAYVPGQRIMYQRNPHFWKKDAQGRRLPYLDKYILLITSDLNSGQRSFLSGTSDVLALQGEDYTVFKQRESKGNYRVHDLGPSWGFSFLGFNMNPAARLEPRKLRLFRNVKFRRAISHSIDRNNIVKNLFAGRARPLFGPITPADTIFYNPRPPRYGYDVATARRLLREIGLRDANHNGLLEWEGREVRFNIITNVENRLRQDMGRQVVSDLRKVGLNAILTPITFSQLVSRLDSPPYQWEAVILGFTGGPEPHEGADIWMSNGNLHTWHPGQKSPATPWEAEVDELFRRGAQTLSEAGRKRIYDRWQVIIGQQQPFTFLAAPNALWAVRKRFGNIKPSSRGGVLWNLEEIYDRTATRQRP